MSTEPTTTPASTGWGDPAPPASASGQPPKMGRPGARTAIAVAVAVVVGAGAGIGIYAATATGSGSNAGRPAAPRNGTQRGPGGFDGQGGPGSGGAAALRNALHGDFVVPDGNGGYTTERLQTGDVTALGATSISLRSTDGYQQTYTIDGDTRTTGSPKTGDTATVVARVSGDMATATAIGQGSPLPRGAGPAGRRDGGN
jgi:hypothetical protein